MPTFIDINNLGTGGVVVQGDAANDKAGRVVAMIGDINGDGHADFVVTAGGGDDGGTDAGEAYVIFGAGANLPTRIDLTNLTPAQGFVVQGDLAGDGLGYGAAAAGDVNGDGFDDLILGADAVGGNDFKGAAYVIFGHAGSFSRIDLSTLTASQGFAMTGGNMDSAGQDVSSAGDINGDGYDDLIIGAPFATPKAGGGFFAGKAYVVFGHAGGFGAINLTTMTAAQGFVIDGSNANEALGQSVAGVGDVDGDGYDDFLVSHRGFNNDTSNGAVYLVYGHAGSFGTEIDISGAVPGMTRIYGAPSDGIGYRVSGLGDVNGDGIGDFGISATANDSGGAAAGGMYVLFGREERFPLSFNVATLGSNEGFFIRGADVFSTAGSSIAPAGDFNGDGYADLIVGAEGDTSYYPGRAYILYGSATGFDAVVDLGNLSPSQGVILRAPLDLRIGPTVGGGSDVNGDGFDDVLVGSYRAGDGGGFSGNGYVIYGRAPTTSVTRIGNALSQTIHGGAGDDTLDGRDGNDVLLGADGDDHLLGGAGSDILSAGSGDDHLEGGSGGDTAHGDDGDDMIQGGSGDDYLYGDAGSDRLEGGSGNDTLDGGSGADVMTGGSGNDSYYVNLATDRAYEDEDSGYDTVYSSATYSLAGQYIEDLYLLGTAAISGTGNALDNRIFGNEGINTLTGGDGNDLLDGMGGADIMVGGLGDDVFTVDNVGDVVREATGQGTDTVFASVTFTLAGQYVENLQLTGVGAINGTGNGLDNAITGNSAANILTGGDGNDTLNGSLGADKMVGGTGNDTYYVDNSGDQVLEAANEGTDTVYASVTFAMGGQYIETLILTGTSAINGTGTSQANTLIGNGAANVLNGSGGDDQIHGMGGSDTLTGGAGIDTYWFETALGTGNVDTITDFNVADDTIDLDRAVFSGIAAAGALDPNAFWQGTAAHDADDRIVYDKATGKLYYDADGSGAGAAIQFAQVTANTALTAADFFAVN